MIAEALNAFCEAIESLDRIDGVKEVCAEFSISGLAFEHVIDGDGHGVSYGNKGSFLATSSKRSRNAWAGVSNGCHPPGMTSTTITRSRSRKSNSRRGKYITTT